MNESIQLLNSIKKRMSGVIKQPHLVSSIGYDILKLKNIGDLKLEKETDYIMEEFLSLLSQWKGILTNQIEYANRIASSNGNLEYEEMHKLFSLCDEIHALQSLGLVSDKKLFQDFEESLRYRFKKEKKKAHLVAQDKKEEWKKNYWWYSENLRK